MQRVSNDSSAAVPPNAPQLNRTEFRTGERRPRWKVFRGLLTPLHRILQPAPESVNWFITPWCNYRCAFCFSTPRGYENRPAGPDGLLISMARAGELLKKLRTAGTRKLTFVGGEPTLVRGLPTLVRWADELGMAPMIVTNGTGLTSALLDELAPHLTRQDHPGAIKLSLDSGQETIERDLGRGRGHHVSMILGRADQIRQRGIPLMLNTVVTAKNWSEDMHPALEALGPIHRWKVFQVLRIEGQNERAWDSLKVSKLQFHEFVRRHADLGPVAEDNDAMTDSYVMVDPIGRVFQNTGGRLTYSLPIFESGVQGALTEVGWSRRKFLARGGRYEVALPAASSPEAA
ncbi:MAG: viperin family antiviral radical SAM protein [Thermoplasmata archaeon]